APVRRRRSRRHMARVFCWNQFPVRAACRLHLTTPADEAGEGRSGHPQPHKPLDFQGFLASACFWNTEVYDELEAVLEAIYRACQARKPLPPPPPPPSPPAGGRGGSGPPPPAPSPPRPPP